MKILVRENTDYGTEYIWKDANRNEIDVCVFRTTDGSYYRETEVLKVKNDCRKKSVICNHCGKVIKNTPEAIEKHYLTKEKKIDCMKCSSLGVHSLNSNFKQRFRQIEGNQYSHTVQQDVSLYCGTSWTEQAIDIASDRNNYANSTCKYFKCRRAGVRAFEEDFFQTYPKAFEVLITEKALIDNNWGLIYKSEHIREYKKGKVHAICDGNGIVKYFSYSHYFSSYAFVYLPTYKKYVKYSDSNYRLGVNPFGDISNSTVNAIKKEIEKLYK